MPRAVIICTIIWSNKSGLGTQRIKRSWDTQRGTWGNWSTKLFQNLWDTTVCIPLGRYTKSTWGLARKQIWHKRTPMESILDTALDRDRGFHPGYISHKGCNKEFRFGRRTLLVSPSFFSPKNMVVGAQEERPPSKNSCARRPYIRGGGNTRRHTTRESSLYVKRSVMVDARTHT